jgi:peptide-methionine (R)-S-oxide reductase
MNPMNGLMTPGTKPLLALGTLVFAGAAIAGIITSLATVNPSPPVPGSAPIPTSPKPSDPSFDDPDAPYRKNLTENQKRLIRERGTEAPFTGEMWNHKGHGLYKCVCCKTSLFDSRAKFDSGTGWPSFYEPIEESRIESRVDGTLLDQREEVICRKCHAHLGHVFPDGPRPTGLRYRLNSAALEFEETMAASSEDR